MIKMIVNILIYWNCNCTDHLSIGDIIKSSTPLWLQLLQLSGISARDSQYRKHTISLDLASPDHKAKSMPVALTQGKKVLYTV